MNPVNNQYDILVKTLLIGDAGVGKTTFCNKLVNDEFIFDYYSTIGVDFFIKYMKINNKIFKLQIWDTAGQERFKSIINSYFRNSNLVIIMLDLNKEHCVSSLQKWLAHVNDSCNNDIKIIVIGNKKDLVRKVTKYELEDILIPKGISYIEISVKEDTNFRKLMEIIYNKIHNIPMNYLEFETINLIKDPKPNGMFDCCTIS